ncbi:MAG: DUF4124 domain-containing protein [Halioglobus sp.]
MQTLTTLQAVALIVAMLSSSSTLAADKFYKWKDSSGIIQISDRPPPSGTPFEEGAINSSGNFIGSNQTRSNSTRQSSDDNTPVNAIGENPGKSPQFIKDPALCASARQNLESLDNFQRIRVQNADGSFRILSPEEKEGERAKAQKIIQLNCD